MTDKVFTRMIVGLFLTLSFIVQAGAQPSGASICPPIKPEDRRRIDSYLAVARLLIGDKRYNEAAVLARQSLILDPCLAVDRELGLFVNSGVQQGDPGLRQPLLTTPALGSPSLESNRPSDEVRSIEVVYEREPSLVVTLSAPLSTNASKPFSYQTIGRLAEPLLTEDGEMLLPAGKDIPLSVSINPGRVSGVAGEAVLSVRPFVIGGSADTALPCSESADDPKSMLRGFLCRQEWQVRLSSEVAFALTPEHAGARIFHVRKGAEGLRGTRRSRMPETHDQVASGVATSAESLVYRNPLTGVIYDLSRLTVGAIKLLFSRRNLYLPPETRLYFKIDRVIRLTKTSKVPYFIDTSRSSSVRYIR